LIDGASERIRVLVYNVKAFRLGTDRAASLIAPHAPDVALVQECGPRYRLHRFARALGMDAASVHFRLRRSIHNAVLVRPPWRILRRRLHRFPPDVRLYPRGALVARVGRAGLRLSIVSLHLGLKPAARRRNVEELVGLTVGLDHPVMTGGDLNEAPGGNAVGWLSGRMWDAFAVGGTGQGETYPASDPTSRIDYLFVDEGFAVEGAAVLVGREAASASDHLPLLVDLRLREPSTLERESPESL
jgi:endonuclease/exonuclease/phosphatase family metal-dependent hydrolase